ncbi:MAG TPA: hypothetical protein VFV68_13765 [Agriterribacter sp.]|nr:hypothetical protein [Agriterribacter sp.]
MMPKKNIIVCKPDFRDIKIEKVIRRYNNNKILEVPETPDYKKLPDEMPDNQSNK